MLQKQKNIPLKELHRKLVVPTVLINDIAYLQRAIKWHLEVIKMADQKFENESERKPICDKLEYEIYVINAHQQYLVIQLRKIVDDFRIMLQKDNQPFDINLANAAVREQLHQNMFDLNVIITPKNVPEFYSKEYLIAKYINGQRILSDNGNDDANDNDSEDDADKNKNNGNGLAPLLASKSIETINLIPDEEDDKENGLNDDCIENQISKVSLLNTKTHSFEDAPSTSATTKMTYNKVAKYDKPKNALNEKTNISKIDCSIELAKGSALAATKTVDKESLLVEQSPSFELPPPNELPVSDNVKISRNKLRQALKKAHNKNVAAKAAAFNSTPLVMSSGNADPNLKPSTTDTAQNWSPTKDPTSGLFFPSSNDTYNFKTSNMTSSSTDANPKDVITSRSINNLMAFKTSTFRNIIASQPYIPPTLASARNAPNSNSSLNASKMTAARRASLFKSNKVSATSKSAALKQETTGGSLAKALFTACNIASSQPKMSKNSPIEDTFPKLVTAESLAYKKLENKARVTRNAAVVSKATTVLFDSSSSWSSSEESNLEAPPLQQSNLPIEQKDLRTHPTEYKQDNFLQLFDLFTPEMLMQFQQRRSKRKRRNVHNNEHADYHYGRIEYSNILRPEEKKKKKFLQAPQVKRLQNKGPKRVSADKNNDVAGPSSRSNTISPNENRGCNECHKNGGSLIQCGSCEVYYHKSCHRQDKTKSSFEKNKSTEFNLVLCPTCRRAQEEILSIEKEQFNSLTANANDLDAKMAKQMKRRKYLLQRNQNFKEQLQRFSMIIEHLKNHNESGPRYDSDSS